MTLVVGSYLVLLKDYSHESRGGEHVFSEVCVCLWSIFKFVLLRSLNGRAGLDSTEIQAVLDRVDHAFTPRTGKGYAPSTCGCRTTTTR